MAVRAIRGSLGLSLLVALFLMPCLFVIFYRKKARSGPANLPSGKLIRVRVKIAGLDWLVKVFGTVISLSA
jgi:hypothetical protein